MIAHHEPSPRKENVLSGELQELRDRLDVSDMITRYAFALDRCEWDEFDAIFADEVTVEMPHVPSGSAVSRAEFKQMAIDTVGGFEATHHPIDPPDPIDAIKFRMEQGGLSLQDLEAYLGRHAADVLARKRPLTLAMRRRLHRGLGIAADVLLQ